jgi:hypothetical protein
MVMSLSPNSNPPSFSGKFLAYPGDVPFNTVIVANAGVASGTILAGTNNYSIQGLPPNAAFQFTTVAFGAPPTGVQLAIATNPPTITVASSGTYLIFAGARFDYNAFAINAARTLTMKLHRTNNGAADLTFPDGLPAQVAFKTPGSGTLTQTLGQLWIPPTLYVTTNPSNNPADIIQLWGYVDAAWTSGTLDVIEASIVAVRIA